MKKLLAAALVLGFATFASAQAPTATAPATTTTTTTTAPKMERKHRMHKPTTAATTTTGAATTGTATTTGAATTTAPGQGKMNHAKGEHHSKRTPAEQQAAAAKSAARDKVIGKSASGEEIHLGPNGGQYYINKEGTKTYLKTSSKLKVN